MYDLLSCCRDSTAIKLALLLQPCWPYKLKQFNKMLQLTGHATGRCNSTRGRLRRGQTSLLAWPKTNDDDAQHSTASAHEARICTIYNFVPRDGATCLASAKRSMINPCWLQLDDSTSSTHTHTRTRTASFICRYISGAQNAASSCGSPPLPLPLCAFWANNSFCFVIWWVVLAARCCCCFLDD